MQESKSNWSGVLFGVTAGVIAMYFLDPQRGRTRRARAREKLMHYGRVAYNYGDKSARHIRNRAYGKYKKMQNQRQSGPVDDTTLEERVRSMMGRKVSHIKSLKISVTNGDVSLAGPILNDEVDELIASIEHLPGVRRVIDNLSKYNETPGHFS